MKTQNKAILIGYLGGDPSIGHTSKGEQFAMFRLATDEYCERPGTMKHWIPTWHNIRIWNNRQVDYIQNNFIKGSHAMVEGKIEYRVFTNKNGILVARTEIIATSIINLDR